MKSVADLFSLEGRVALVTGSSRGLGWAMAQALAGAGAKVVVNARDATLAGERAAAINGTAVIGDVSEEAGAVQVVAETFQKMGRLDILVNNAGTIRRGSFTSNTTQEWSRVLDLNLNAAFILAREAVKPMRSTGFGRIINIGSVMSGIARPGAASYVTTKHALVGLTRALAVEYGPYGVTANLIGPGFFATELNADARMDPAFSRQVTDRTPSRRWGEPDDLAGAVVFLASRSAAYVNGQVLYVDGGMVGSF